MSLVSDVSADLASFLAGIAELTGETISSVYIPNFDRAAMSGRSIVIYPEARETAIVSRSTTATTIQMQLGIVEPYEQSQEADQMEELQGIADSIIDSCLGKRLGGSTNAFVETIEQPVVASREMHSEYRLAATFLTVGLKI